MNIIQLLVILIVVLMNTNALALDLDEKLFLIKKVYDLKSKKCDSNSVASEEEIEAGKLLFNSTALSGDRDIACANCHLDDFGSADGIPMAVGVGGKGKGYDRLENMEGVLVQRNALSLIGRSNVAFTSYFWDGKVQIVGDKIISQFGDSVEGKFDSPLALAAILPLVERDEFLGKSSIIRSNDIQNNVENKVYFQRYMAVSDALRYRFKTQANKDDEKIAIALLDAKVDLGKLELAPIGNLLAAFIDNQFPCKERTWDKYLAGHKQALTESQKKGAILFYGKARCASCHSGEFFSDFKFYSIGVPQGLFGPHSRHRDLGRAGVTNKVEHMYQFRTPPLNNVSSTAPYGHNGMFKDLRSIVVHHFNPIRYYIQNPQKDNDEFFSVGKILDSREDVLSTIDLNSEQELKQLLEFMNAI